MLQKQEMIPTNSTLLCFRDANGQDICGCSGKRAFAYLMQGVLFSNAIWHSLFWRFLGVWENRHLPNAHLIIFRAMNLLQLGWQYRAWLARNSRVHHYSLLCFLRFSTRFSKLSCFYVIIYIKVEFLFSQELTS